MEADDLITHPHVMLGALDEQTHVLHEIAGILRSGGSGPRETDRLNWGATGVPYADVNLGETARGFLIINDGTTDVFVAQSPARLNATGALFIVPAGTWLAIPLETRRICFGGATTSTVGTALVMTLDHAPDFAIGVLAGIGSRPEQVVGTVGPGVADDGSAPVKIGAVYRATLPTLVDGQRSDLFVSNKGGVRTTILGDNNTLPADTSSGSDALGNSAGMLRTLSAALGWNGASWDRVRAPGIVKTVSVTAAGNTALWTPTAGKKFRILRILFDLTSNASRAAAAVTTISLQDAAADIGVTFDVFVPTAAVVTGFGGYTSGWIDLGNGILSALANNVLNVNLSAALATGVCRVTCVGVEE